MERELYVVTRAHAENSFEAISKSSALSIQARAMGYEEVRRLLSVRAKS